MKKTLNMAELDAQTAVELPDRDLMALVTIIIAGNDVDIIRDVTITVRNVDVAAQICAGVLNNQAGVTCTFTQ